ncbi:hypothetical protein SD1D_1692 [Herbinix luporum]|uniref:Uncharacterized protein n=1 Tax=Herbinix luporum TaxID=1679721 RepID=A0A0K8J7E9_9FIRM|nr:hypothetical protein SD1D_1692 [Herbinix luporum]
MNNLIKYLIYVFSFIFIILFTYIIYGSKSYKINLIIQKIYKFLNNFPISRSYVSKISYRYRLISPCHSKTIARKTVSTCIISWSISICAFLLIFISNRRLITLITVGFAIYIINSEVASRLAKKHEIKLLTEMQKMLEDIVHYFYMDYRIDNAIYRAREKLSQDMKAAVDQIYDLLLSTDREEGLREYYDNVPNKYLRTFVSQCIGLMEHGDQVIDGKLLFIRNLENLQREIDIEIDKQQRLNMEFMGVILCVVSPIFCIELVKQFAISIKENMFDFYYGRWGFLLDLCLLLIISSIYIIMRKSAEYTSFHQSSHKWLLRIDRIGLVKKAMDNYCTKNASKQERLQRKLRNNGSNIKARYFVLRSFILAISVFILSVGITIYLHQYSRSRQLLVKEENLEVLIPTVKEVHYDSIAHTIETYTRKYIERPDIIPNNSHDMVDRLKKDGIIYSPLVAEAIAEDILDRVIKYQNDYFSFLDLVICLYISILAYYLPKILLKYSGIVSKDAMEDEVNQFNALIGMLMYNDTMTVKQILQEMESFAVVFKQSIRICIDEYGSDDIYALIKLKEREPYEPFRRIVDNLIRCDEMPISMAFNEIQVDRDGYISKRKLANEKSIKKRVIRAYVLAALPFLLLFSYGLMPVLISAIKEINLILNELQNTVW